MPKPQRPPTTVYIIMHYEYFESGHIDCLQFHVSSSLKKAEEYFKIIHVDPYSWWQVHPYVVDADPRGDEGEEVYYYSYRGKRLKQAPHKQAKKAWDKESAKRKLRGW